MGNKRFDRERILQYIKEGWHFRIKVVKGREYITRRKGQVERSLGPFSQELWNSIIQLRESESSETLHRISALDNWEKKQRKLEEKISLHRGVVMMTSCKNRDDDAYCNYWNWKNKPSFFMILDELYGKKNYKKKSVFVQEIGSERTMVDRWVVKTFQWYCSSCSAYSPRALAK